MGARAVSRRAQGRASIFARSVRRALYGALVPALLLSGGFARGADDAAATAGPVPSPEDPSRYLADRSDRALERAGKWVFVAGALADLYTTKQAFDLGLQEQNPLLRPFASRRGGLTAVALSKVAVWSWISRSGRGASDGRRFRANLYFSFGAVQIGIGIVNRHTIAVARARAAASASSAPSPPVPSVSAGTRPAAFLAPPGGAPRERPR